MRNLIFVTVLVFELSCSIKKHNPYINNEGISPEYLASLDTLNYTNIKWINHIKDLGTIKQGTNYQLSFVFKNIGLKPLFIVDAGSTCDCTVLQIPLEPIYSDEYGVIKINLKTNNEINYFVKKISIITNTIPSKNYLIIRGFIYK